MAEPAVATKAPENDAAEDIKMQTSESLVPGDTPAQSGASLGVCWSSGSPLSDS
jgi:hypothetical protein